MLTPKSVVLKILKKKKKILVPHLTKFDITDQEFDSWMISCHMVPQSLERFLSIIWCHNVEHDWCWSSD